MGKGDQRTRRGKLYRGTYGRTRLRKRKKNRTEDQSKERVKGRQEELAADFSRTGMARGRGGTHP